MRGPMMFGGVFMSLKLVKIALAEAAPALVGQNLASLFGASFIDYFAATGFSILGIGLRHLFDIGEKVKAGNASVKLDVLAFFIDLGTAPALGIMLYIGCSYLKIEGIFAAGAIVFMSFLGPAWVRSLGGGVADALLSRLKGGGNKPP